jgi:UDP-N-acetylglucosamine 4,6-dehydratase
MQNLKNKTVLITGGTGFLGKALTREFVNQNLKKIIIFSRDEQKQFKFAKEFNNKQHKNLRFFIGDVRDKERLKIALKEVDVVFHAAAMKHVGISEYNPTECVKTNINGSENLISAALSCKVKKVLAISTDKAVNPLNLYGASKLASEKLFISANSYSKKNECKFSVARYGNVHGSTGSVVEVFKNLKNEGKNILPITDKQMTRFWISIKNAIHFINNCEILMRGGEIFIPKIPSIRITDLAKSIIPGCKFKSIGVQPGEKLDEVLFSKEESVNIIEFKNYFLLKPTINLNNYDYEKSLKNENGKKLTKNYAYSSNINKTFLSQSDIKKYLK